MPTFENGLNTAYTTATIERLSDLLGENVDDTNRLRIIIDYINDHFAEIMQNPSWAEIIKASRVKLETNFQKFPGKYESFTIETEDLISKLQKLEVPVEA